MARRRSRRERRRVVRESMAAASVTAARASQLPGFVEAHEGTGWLRRRAADVVENWPAGCSHVASGKVEVFPLVAPLWAGAISCNPCAIEQIPQDGSLPSGQCDRCGTPIGPGDTVHVDSVLIKSLLICFALCTDCQRREDPTFEEVVN